MPKPLVDEPASWTSERVSRALRLYLLENQTASAVAEALGGVTRGAVIAKLRRLGHLKRNVRSVCRRDPASAVAAAATTQARVNIGHRRLPPQRPPVSLPPLREVTATGDPVPLACLPKAACRWPINDPGPGLMHLTLFCAGPAADGRYCPAHRAIAFRREGSEAE